MRSTITLLTALLIAAPLPAHAACQSKSTATSLEEPKILVPFAVPIGLPVATFAPYFYSAAQFQPATALPLPRGEGRGEGAASAEIGVRNAGSQANAPRANQSAMNSASTADRPLPTAHFLISHCSSCHSGPAPKAGLALDDPDALSLTDRLRAIRAVASGQMPKGTKLTNNEIRTLIQQLTATTP